ncbi:MAG: sigma-70 family RNA polymerase sigma factor [Planctomycetota bacterium]|nr:sigma-70 family RNA polymerase sigma factor [Planctomycetota bacterium]
MAQARDGSEQASVELYERYCPRVMGFVLRTTGDRDLAEEVFCETFAAFFRTLNRYERRGSVCAYLLQIARSKLADELNARRRRRPGPWDNDEPAEEPPRPAMKPDESAQSAELAALAQNALLHLPEHLREVVVLRVYERVDYESIGRIVGAGEATVRSRMRYALESLRKMLATPVANE